MKKLIASFAVVALLSGCGVVDNVVNGVKSTVGALDRTVTLYNANGEVIRKWETSNQIEYSGSLAAFVANDGTNVRVSGTFVIEGK